MPSLLYLGTFVLGSLSHLTNVLNFGLKIGGVPVNPKLFKQILQEKRILHSVFNRIRRPFSLR